MQNRGAEVINARGASSAASAASAAIDHMRDWVLGSDGDSWVSMGTYSTGSYGVTSELMYSFPTQCSNREFKTITDLELDEFSREMIALSEKELIKERDMIRWLLC